MKGIDRNFQIAALISKSLSGDLTSEETRALNNWLAENEDNKSLFEKLTSDPYCLQALINSRNDGKTEKAWRRLETEIDAANLRKASKFRVWQYAAVLIPLFILGFMAQIYLKNKTTEPAVRDVVKTGSVLSKENVAFKATPGKQQAKLILSSGKEVDLNSSTSGQALLEPDGTKLLNENRTLNYSSNAKQESELIFNSLVVPKGGEYQLVLADGTKVWLNSASSIRFPTSFGGSNRQVFLSGEAYFEVKKDAARPFIVTTSRSDVTVLGTHFNVKAYPDESFEKTTLAKGSVKVALNILKSKIADAKVSEVLLKPGFQSSVSDSRTIIVAKANLNEALSWKNGMFIFDNETLESAVRKLARWYNVDVSYADNDIKQYHFTGRIKRQDNIVTLLEMIEATANVRFKLDRGQLVLSKKD